MIPDSNDEIRQEQMREMELLNTTTSGNTGTSPNDTSVLKNPPICNNSDGQEDIASDETGSNSSAQVRLFIFSVRRDFYAVESLRGHS